MKMTPENKIIFDQLEYKANSFFYKKHKYKLVNSFVFNWESDYFGLDHNGMTVEIEVKTSRTDFTNEFRNKVKKHEILKNGNPDNVRIPNQFYFFSDPSIISIKDVPEYAGLIHCDLDSGKTYIVKSAKMIHNKKYKWGEIILKKLYRYYLDRKVLKVKGLNQ